MLNKYTKRPKKICLVSRNPTDPTFLRPTLFLGGGTSENFSSISRVFLCFPYIKKFSKKKKVCLPTNPKKYLDVSGNKINSFGLTEMIKHW